MRMAADIRRKRGPDTGDPIVTRQSIAPNSVYRAESRESRESVENEQPKKNWEWKTDVSTKPNSGDSVSSRKPPVPYQVRRAVVPAAIPPRSRPARVAPATRNITKPRQAVARAPPDNDPVTRQMIDRDTLRLRSRKLFEAAISYWRKEQVASANTSMIQEEENSIRVFVRKRPLFEHEKQKEFDVVWVPDRRLVVHNCLFQADLKTAYITHSVFKFDGCFSESATNDLIFDECRIREMLTDSMMSGNVSTVFMFGQTGSGKTFTMTAIEKFVCEEIFTQRAKVVLEFIELCGKKVFDLLEKGDSLKLKERGDGSLMIDGLSSLSDFPACSDLVSVIQSAHSRRRTESTGANAVSSRSHAVCVFKFPESGGKLVLVDLAGSERRKDSMWHDKDRQREGAEINASLHALKECIRWRVARQRPGNGPPAPFRLSSLTRILAEAFTHPKSRLTVIATVSPCATDIEHTLSTLKAVHALTDKTIEEIKQVDLNKIEKQRIGSPNFLSLPPKKWTYKDISEWLSKHGETCAETLPKGTTGLMLIRMSETRFIQLFGEKTGTKLYRDLHDLIAGGRQRI